MLLADLTVEGLRGGSSGSERRLGPVLSRRIHTTLTSMDGSVQL